MVRKRSKLGAELEAHIEHIRNTAIDRKGNDTRPRHLCPRLGSVVTLRECQDCKADKRVRISFRQQAESRMIQWWRYHCPYETEVGPAPLISEDESIANNHWRDVDDEAQEAHLEQLEFALATIADGALLSSRLSHNLRYWMRDAVSHLKFLAVHVSSEAGEYHLGKLKKFISMLDGEMTTWDRLQQDSDPSGARLGGAKRAATERCIFSLEVIGPVKETCCGGKVKEVDQWGCHIFGTTTERICAKCPRYIGQASLRVSYPVDLLVGSKECDDCKDIELKIRDLQGTTRELHVLNLQQDGLMRRFLDERMEREDMYGPALFTEMNFKTNKYAWSTDDPDEILEYLEREGYVPKD